MFVGSTETINLPEKLSPPNAVSANKMGYIPKLYEAYFDAEKPETISQANIASYLKYRFNLHEQREYYYNALYVMERVREGISP